MKSCMFNNDILNVEIINEDCLNIFKKLKDNSIDLIVKDPPYRTISGGNKNLKWKSGYGKSVLYKNDGKIFENNNINHYDWIRECFRVLKNNKHIYIMTNLLNLFEIKDIAERVGFKLHNLLVWEKNNCNANRWYMKNCEYILFFRKGKAVTIHNPSSKTVHKYYNIIGNKNHPTEKPVDLMKLYIENSSSVSDMVFDPFMGSGSTGIACIETNRNFIGIEIDNKYYEIAKNRINEAFNNKLYEGKNEIHQ